MLVVKSDEFFMKQAIIEAQKAMDAGEVPIGSVVVCNDVIIARGHNQTELLQDVTAHAEMIAITSAENNLGAKYLPDCTLYVTLEPCVMCAGALKWVQVGRVVYGAADDKGGFMKFGKEILHPQTKLEYGVLQQECSSLLKAFFKNKR